MYVKEPPPLQGWLTGSKPELGKLGLYEGCSAFIGAFSEGGIRDVTAVWCKQAGISDKTARRRQRKFIDRIRELKDHALVREFYNLIEANGIGRQVVLAVTESKATREAREAKSAAARQLADFYKTLTPEARTEAEKEVREFAASETSKDMDEIISRRNPEIASATRFIATDAGEGDIKQQEAVALCWPM